MKKLILTLFILLTVIMTISCQKDTFNVFEGNWGNSPIVLLSTHGGNIKTREIKNRDCEKYTCTTDLYTNEILLDIEKELESYNILPFTFYTLLDRQEIDLNRNAAEACADESCFKYYKDFFNTLTYFITSRYPKDLVLVIDIHGQAHEHGYIELGYNIPHDLYEVATNDKNILNLVTMSSLKAIPNRTIQDLTTGTSSLGFLLDEYYNVAPSFKNPVPPTPYFNGGYITETLSQLKNVVVIQLELPYDIRKNSESRKKFAKIFAKQLAIYSNMIN